MCVCRPPPQQMPISVLYTSDCMHIYGTLQMLLVMQEQTRIGKSSAAVLSGGQRRLPTGLDAKLRLRAFQECRASDRL